VDLLGVFPTQRTPNKISPSMYPFVGTHVKQFEIAGRILMKFRIAEFYYNLSLGSSFG
jgi:hypothetical protein